VKKTAVVVKENTALKNAKVFIWSENAAHPWESVGTRMGDVISSGSQDPKNTRLRRQQW